ncbi:MAG: TIGR02757 family protein [Chitinophagales bacterium]|nr:TIGR02757 family protein [Chitinophagales bacterium]MBP9704914.1 TIGR02757 family protein [Chitinophagales bacterium]
MNLRSNQQVTSDTLKQFLDSKVLLYNNPDFIINDPISIPHQFQKLQDIEIMGFWTAMLAWGQRVTIINKAKELIALMDGAPHDFILNHQETDLKRFLQFKHRTFNATDALYFIHFFKNYYQQHYSLEDAFLCKNYKKEINTENMLVHFNQTFFSLPDLPHRTKKHVSTPSSKSSCKRLNMFLRWMVRNDNTGVDFGVWKKIKPSQLICPLDLHVDRVARNIGLITRKQTDWQTALELTDRLKEMDAKDPVKYDFALFGLGVTEKMQ